MAVRVIPTDEESLIASAAAEFIPQSQANAVTTSVARCTNFTN